MSKNTKKPKNDKPRPMPVASITITLMSDNQVAATWPDELGYMGIMKIMGAATGIIGMHYIQGVAENRYDKSGLPKKSSIVIPQGISNIKLN